MDIQLACEDLKVFLKRCYSGGLVKDLVIQANSEGIFAHFSHERNIYGEVYLKNVKVIEEGVIRVPNVKKLMDVISRADSKIIKIKSNDDVFVITDGVSIGKMKVDLLQAGGAEIIESYNEIKDHGARFDRQTLNFMLSGIQYENGCKITHGMLSEVLKDAKAFGYEVYNFQTKEIKNKKWQLRCFIINQHTTEKLQRVLVENDFIGDVTAIPETIVGKGFRDILEGILGEDKEIVEIYIHENSWLITDRENYFYNIATLDE